MVEVFQREVIRGASRPYKILTWWIAKIAKMASVAPAAAPSR